MTARISVVGSGVVGLSIAHELATAGHTVTVVSDSDPLDSTSAVAGAIWFPYAAESSPSVDDMLRVSLRRFTALASVHESGVDMRAGLILERSPQPDRSWAEGIDARPARGGELPPVAHAAGATAMLARLPLATMSQYLPWLAGECRAMGVRFAFDAVATPDALAASADLLVVAGGLRSGAMLGDPTVTPIRGQVVRVANPGIWNFIIDDDNPEGLTYVLPRRDSVVLGGTHDVGDDSLVPDPETETAILARTAALVPELAGLPVLSRAVGLRPARPTLRIEEVPGYAVQTIAAYGHGGSGMTLSWGTAQRVAEMVG